MVRLCVGAGHDTRLPVGCPHLTCNAVSAPNLSGQGLIDCSRQKESVVYRRRWRHVRTRGGGGLPAAGNIRCGIGQCKPRGPRPRQWRRERTPRVGDVRNRHRRYRPSFAARDTHLMGCSGAEGMRNLRSTRRGGQEQEANKRRYGPV